MLARLITVLLDLITLDSIRDILDEALDKIEDKVKASEGKIDDILVLPLCAKIRQLLNIPDNDAPGDNADNAEPGDNDVPA